MRKIKKLTRRSAKSKGAVDNEKNIDDFISINMLH